MNLEPENYWQPNSVGGYLAAFREYKDAVARLFPSLDRRVLDERSIFPVDVLFLGYFLEYYPQRAVVLEVGAFAGASTFCFASHPKVSRVTSVTPNTLIADDLAAGPDTGAGRVNLEPPKDLGMLDIARATLAEFAEECEKVQLRESAEDTDKGDIPVVGLSEGEGPVALVDGLRTRDGARETLTAIFERNPHAIVFLDDCRYTRGLFTQAGVADFMDRVKDEYHFHLVGDLGPGLASSNLGVVYSDQVATEVREVLAEVSGTFSKRLDPLRLLSREEELIGIVNRVNQQFGKVRDNNRQLAQQVSQLKLELNEARNKSETRPQAQVPSLRERETDLAAQVSRLKKHNDYLTAHYSSRRYRFADTVVESVTRILGVRSLLRRLVHAADNNHKGA